VSRLGHPVLQQPRRGGGAAWHHLRPQRRHRLCASWKDARGPPGTVNQVRLAAEHAAMARASMARNASHVLDKLVPTRVGRVATRPHQMRHAQVLPKAPLLVPLAPPRETLTREDSLGGQRRTAPSLEFSSSRVLPLMKQRAAPQRSLGGADEILSLNTSKEARRLKETSGVS